jgi:hypothetical protein
MKDFLTPSHFLGGEAWKVFTHFRDYNGKPKMMRFALITRIRSMITAVAAYQMAGFSCRADSAV